MSLSSEQSYSASQAGVTNNLLLREDLLATAAGTTVEGPRYAHIIDQLQSQVNVLQAQMAIRDEESTQQRQMIKQLIEEITLRGGTSKGPKTSSAHFG